MSSPVAAVAKVRRNKRSVGHICTELDRFLGGLKPKGKRVKSGSVSRLVSGQFSGLGSGSVCRDSGPVLVPKPSFGGGNLAPQFDTSMVVSESRKVFVLPVAVS